MMKNIIIFFIIIIFALSITYFINGCGNDPVKPVTNTNPGILETDNFGNILGGDTTDWCLGTPLTFSFGPAYPNPTLGPGVRIKFSVPTVDTVMVYFLKDATDTTVFFSRSVMPGFYEISINDSTHMYNNTYQRVYFKSKKFPSSAFCRFYGDIKFTQ